MADQQMDMQSMIKAFEKEVDSFDAELNKLTNKMVTKQDITREDEMLANQFMRQLDKIKLQEEEFRLYVQLYFYDISVFEEELPQGEEGYKIIKNLHEFLEERAGVCEALRMKLLCNLEGAHKFAESVRQQKKKEELESLTKEQVQEDISAYMADFQKDMLAGLADIKQGQKELHEELVIAQEKGEELHEGIKETTETVKAANAETTKAKEALKKNKDTLYLGLSVVICAAAVLILIFM